MNTILVRQKLVENPLPDNVEHLIDDQDVFTRHDKT